MNSVPKRRIRIYESSLVPTQLMRPLSSLVILLLLFSSRIEAGKQRDETDSPTLSPLPEPTVAPTRGPTETPTTKMPTFIPTMEPTTPVAPTNETKNPSGVPTTFAPTGSTMTEDLYTLDLPEMELTFTMPSGTTLTLDILKKDWQSFLTTVLQVAVGANVDRWTIWDSDVTYTTITGFGIARASGQVAVTRGLGRRLQQDITQATLETELYGYFFIWGMDESWEYFVARGYPMTSLKLDFLGDSMEPRRAEPEGLASLRAPAQVGNDDKRNAWIAGVVMGAVVLIVASVVALLYLQRRGDHSDNLKAPAASSPRTMAVSEVASPRGPEESKAPPPFGRDMDILLGKNMVVGVVQMEDISAVPSMSESSFCYDASRLDQVIDSARGYELPYAVPNHTFSDLTNDIKDVTNNDEDEEDDILKETQGNTLQKATDTEMNKKLSANRTLTDKDPSFHATHFEDITLGTGPSSPAAPYNDIPFGNSDMESMLNKADFNIHYSPSLFDDEKKETETTP